jgi:hypothetical protein
MLEKRKYFHMNILSCSALALFIASNPVLADGITAKPDSVSVSYNCLPTVSGDTTYNMTVFNGTRSPLFYIVIGDDELNGEIDVYLTDTVTGIKLKGVRYSAPSKNWKSELTPVSETTKSVMVWKNLTGGIPSGQQLTGFKITVPHGIISNISKSHFILQNEANQSFHGLLRDSSGIKNK